MFFAFLQSLVPGADRNRDVMEARMRIARMGNNGSGSSNKNSSAEGLISPTHIEGGRFRMKNRYFFGRIVFLIIIGIALLCVAVNASAEECAPGTHNLVEVITLKPTCNAEGKAITKCTVCGYVVKSSERTVSMLPHDFTWTTDTAPQCQIKGREHQVCKVCGSIGEYRDLPALDHDWASWNVTTAATCTTEGVETRICKLNSAHKETRPIAPLGHKWGDWVTTKQPTCEAAGEKTRTCQNDPSHQEKDAIAPIGHKWDGGKVTKEPDCTNPGVKTYTCQNDPSHTKTEPIAVVPDAHKWDGGKVTKAPNCTEPGVKTYTCQINSAHTKTEAIPIEPNAHDWDNGTVTKAPTCEQPGVKTYVCRINAAHTKTETIPATGHKWDQGVVTKKPTLTEEGEKKYTCQNDPSHIRIEKLAVITMSNNTVCAFGPRLRDVNLYPYNTDLWYMFTPFDASKDGVQTYELVASNMYIVGSVTLTIKDGNLTINYKLNDPHKFTVTLEFFTVLNRIGDLVQYEPEDLVRMGLSLKKNQPINLAEKFGDDTNLVLYFCSRCDYTYSDKYTSLNYGSTAHQRLLNTMLDLMD